MQYWTCPCCGDNLDPGERHRCEDKKEDRCHGSDSNPQRKSYELSARASILPQARTKRNPIL